MTKQTSKKLGVGMGWFGIALGTAEALFPRTIARMIGVDPDGIAPLILRAMGLRELAASAVIFAKPDQPASRWARVAGDAVDLGLLAAAAFARGTGKGRLAWATAAVLGATALDVIAALPAEDADELAPQMNHPSIGKASISQPVLRH
jgi:hypothetical protein